MKEKVLVLDANERSALAITRALGTKGVFVCTADSETDALSYHSKYSKKQFTYTSPYIDKKQFVIDIEGICKKEHFSMVIPVTEVTTYSLSNSNFETAILPIPDYKTIMSLADKNNLFRLSQSLNIPTPRTIFIESLKQIELKLKEITYPAVIKPSLSKVIKNNGFISTAVQIAKNEIELLKILNETPYFKDISFSIQEYIPGHGKGVFALYNHGEEICFFSHERIREKPPSGGVSVLCKSVAVDSQLKKYSSTLLKQANWHGVAMVEFRITPEGKPYIMEINPRFWGSLQLSIDAGLNFPYILYSLLVHKNHPTRVDYKENIMSRWLLGDLDRVYLILKNHSQTQYSIRDKLFEILQFLKLWSPRTNYEINRLTDIHPFIYECKNYIKSIFSGK